MNLNPECIFIYASTNKVYGDMGHLAYREHDKMYLCDTYPQGIPLSCPIDLKTPYGVSKGSADYYVREYSRYGINTYSLRQSCIAGENQLGDVNQGWLEYIVQQIHRGEEITIYGDGFQTRDILYVSDLISLYRTIFEKPLPQADYGHAFNVGGGIHNAISVLQLIEQLGGVYKFADARKFDQKYFVSDNMALFTNFNWNPTTPLNSTIKKIIGSL